MLTNTHFYYSLTRKYVVLFGNMFNNISIIRKDTESHEELKRFKVPILYGPKEKFVTRMATDPNLQKETQITLPRMSFEITGMNYDASRKQNSLLKVAKGESASRTSAAFMGVPYDLTFQLNIYVKNIDDGTQIVEQILPYFNPDYTITINALPELGFLKDIPLILNSVDNNIEYEGNFDSVRYINWTLNFTMKCNYYGPISTPKIIRKVIANIFNDPSLVIGYLTRINTANGNNGTFKINDIVYQGDNYQTANAYGIVSSWSANTGKLTVGSTQGHFSQNNTIHALSTNATYTLASFDLTPLKLVEITVEPKPNTAAPGDTYGYETTIWEYGQDD